jgi:4-hydroxy-tetrahydrodipicolinate synthase
VAGNEIPAEMARHVELVEANDWGAARALHTSILPLMTVNFVESNPIPVKAAMSRMGLLQEHFRLPMVPPRDESRRRIDAVLAELNLMPAGATAGARG